MTQTDNTRAAEAARIRAEHPDWSYAEIGAEMGVSRQRVGELLRTARVLQMSLPERVAEIEEKAKADAAAVLEAAKRAASAVNAAADERAARTRSATKIEEIRREAKAAVAKIRREAKTKAAEIHEAAQERIRVLQVREEGWPEAVVAKMEQQLREGASPLDLVADPEVAAWMPAARKDEDTDVEATRRRHSQALRVLINRGKSLPEGEVARRLYDARQIGRAAKQQQKTAA
ncbi:MAG TPA: hypothetical protein VGF17_29435 [Phytomonospora sp.]